MDRSIDRDDPVRSDQPTYPPEPEKADRHAAEAMRDPDRASHLAEGADRRSDASLDGGADRSLMERLNDALHRLRPSTERDGTDRD